MPPAEKKSAVDIIQRYHNNVLNVECCHELTKALQVSMSDLLSLQPAIFLAMEFPQHCERGVIYESTLASNVVKDEVATIESRHAKANEGMTMFEHNPARTNRMELFDHQIAFR